MRVSDTIVKLLYGTSAFPAYMMGVSVARREKWMERARKAGQPERAMCVRSARQVNHELLEDFREFRRRNPEGQQ